MSDQQQQQQQQPPQSSRSPLDCSPWPHHHIHTGAEAAASFPEFCQAFGFPVGPSGSGSLLLFYELLDQSGALVQRGRVTGCTQLGQHPWAMLFAPHSYLCSVLDVCDSVSSVRLYTSHSPCEDPGSQCCSLLLSFLEERPWLRLDLLFAQLRHIQPWWPQAASTREALRSLAALWPRVTLSPLSGRAWALLLGSFVADVPLSVRRAVLLPGRVEADWRNAVELSAITGMGPAYLDLPAPSTTDDTNADPNQASAGPKTILPPPHLLTTEDPHPDPARRPPLLSQRPQRPTPRGATQPIRPINVVRHVRAPRPLATSDRPGSHASIPSLLLKGRPVEVVCVREREVDHAGSSAHTHTHTHTEVKRSTDRPR
ncbi:putative C-_U-editing enzyme APOBEC-4 [Alosa sapidissima]|uniref:putative C->U-editing enzyme APOBEC-4 n=1 Tax=Alosa sapidissima TaxID=34773 RepID=UPI001C08A6B9|nr:putative C->U-editing enzyme APOBEC-4 [Alosa sapidissima]